jgi:hypothetical protein
MWIAVLLLLPACVDPGQPADDPRASCADPKGDYDSDGIADGLEQCSAKLDSDGDGQPDWQDSDADGDGIEDRIERGPADQPPRDTDGDGLPDYLDRDADNDGVVDGDEDLDGDGELGCCLRVCGQFAGDQARACRRLTAGEIVGQTPLAPDEAGCGLGQRCRQGRCEPPLDLRCSAGETSPLQRDTFGDGLVDARRGTFVCRQAPADEPLRGRRAVQTQRDAAGDWTVVLDPLLSYQALTVDAPAAAALIDGTRDGVELAGFIVSRPTDQPDATAAIRHTLGRIQAKAPGGRALVSLRSEGVVDRSHDGHDLLRSVTIDLSYSAATGAAAIRADLLELLLGGPLAVDPALTRPVGPDDRRFVIRLAAVRRDPGHGGRLVVSGAVARRAADERTATHLADLADGSSVGRADARLVEQCEVVTIDHLPLTDIVWVIDESGSTEDKRDKIVQHAADFFARARDAGLDFRMGVTSMVSPSGEHAAVVGKFCSVSSDDEAHDGGTDRFLAADEAALFAACIHNPPGADQAEEYGLVNLEAALSRHLPRAAADPGRFRPGAKIAVVVVADAPPFSLVETLGEQNFEICTLPRSKQQGIDAAVQPTIDLLSGAIDPQLVASFHTIGGICSSGCDIEGQAHGYREIARALGGQVGDICQDDLGAALDDIIDQIIGEASPIVLDRAAISASLAVAAGDRPLPRQGPERFDYRRSANAVALIGVPFRRGTVITTSYLRWQQPGPVK